MKMINKKTVSVFFILVLIIIAYFVFFTRDGEEIEVKTMDSYRGNIEKTLKISGDVSSSDSEIINISPNLKIAKTYFEENDKVKKGDLLAELEKEDLENSLKKAELNLAQLEKDLKDISNSSSNSQKLILLNSVEKAKNNLDTLKRDLEKAKDDLKTSENLFENSAISEKEYQSQVDLVDSLESNLKTAEITYEDAKLNLSSYNSNQSSAEENLELQIESIKVDIDSLNKSISDRNIYSNIDGVISDFNLKEGRTTDNSSYISIYSDSDFEFVSFVPQEDAVLIENNQEVEISVDGLGKIYSGYVFSTGKIAEVDTSSGSQTPKVEVNIKITNADDKIASGYTGDAVISIDKLEDVLLVRNESIKEDDKGSFLFKVDNNKVSKVYIEKGISDGYYTVVNSGVEESESIVLNPPMELEDESTVKIVD